MPGPESPSSDAYLNIFCLVSVLSKTPDGGHSLCSKGWDFCGMTGKQTLTPYDDGDVSP